MLKKVMILQEWVPPYREPFFRYLREIGIKSGVDYRVIAGQGSKVTFGKLDRYSSSEIDILSKNSVLTLFRREMLYQNFPSIRKNVDLVVCEHALRNLKVDYWSFIRKPSKIALWGHGKTQTKKISAFETHLKRLMLKRADWYFAYTKSGAEHVISQGFPEIKVSCLFNSTDTTEIIREGEALSRNEIEKFNTSLSIDSEQVAVFIGALHESKRIDFLIQASILIKEEVPNFRLVIFGKGPLISLVQDASKEYTFISYGGEANSRTKALIARIASVILMPGRVGLISVDSMAMGVPIITTNWNMHAPEFEYLTHGSNAIITTDDVRLFAKGAIDLLQNHQLLQSLKLNCKNDSNLYSIERMAGEFHTGVLEILFRHEKLMSQKIFGGLDFPILDLSHAITFFAEHLQSEGRAVHFVNSYTISQAFSQPELLAILRSDILIPDGTPLSKFLRNYYSGISTTRGPDFMREFLRQSNSDMTHYFLGSTSSVVSKLVERVTLENENLNIAGFHCPEENVEYSLHIQEWAQKIRSSGAMYVWIGLGTPKQDYVAHELSKLLPSTCFAVGAAFDYLSGNLKEAPKTIRNSGYEWLYRLTAEPSRLWKRYLIGNTHFFYICLREFIRQMR